MLMLTRPSAAISLSIYPAYVTPWVSHDRTCYYCTSFKTRLRELHRIPALSIGRRCSIVSLEVWELEARGNESFGDARVGGSSRLLRPMPRELLLIVDDSHDERLMVDG